MNNDMQTKSDYATRTFHRLLDILSLFEDYPDKVFDSYLGQDLVEICRWYLYHLYLSGISTGHFTMFQTKRTLDILCKKFSKMFKSRFRTPWLNLRIIHIYDTSVVNKVSIDDTRMSRFPSEWQQVVQVI